MDSPKLPSLKPYSRESVISDDMLSYWFKGTCFGCEHTPENLRKLLANGLLKHQAGWHNGHTMQQMIKRHEVVNKRGHINKRGRLFLCEYFKSSNV